MQAGEGHCRFMAAGLKGPGRRPVACGRSREQACGGTGLGPHQELTDAEGCQWPSGGLLGSGGSKEVHPALPREHRAQCGPR